MSCYLGLHGDNLDTNTDPIAAGDKVTVGYSKFPVYDVIAVHAGKAWVVRSDDPNNGVFEGITPVSRLKRQPAEVIELSVAA